MKNILSFSSFNEASLVPKAFLKNVQWKEYVGEDMPESLKKFCEEGQVFKYGGHWYDAFYHGDIETTPYWIIVTDNGGFYKVGANLGIWHRVPGRETVALQCTWSTGALKKSLKSLLSNGTTVMDPGYQT